MTDDFLSFDSEIKISETLMRIFVLDSVTNKNNTAIEL